MEVSSDPLEDDLGLVLEPVSVLVPPEEVELAEGEVVICWPGDTSSELRPPDTQYIGFPSLSVVKSHHKFMLASYILSPVAS